MTYESSNLSYEELMKECGDIINSVLAEIDYDEWVDGMTKEWQEEEAKLASDNTTEE